MRLLVVEDEPQIRELMSFLLDSLGVEVEVEYAADGVDALKKAKLDPPDLIFLDIVLPRMDGITLCRVLKRDPVTQDVPVYMLTAKVRESDHRAAEEAGADGYLEKPFHADHILAVIEGILDGG